MPFRRLLNLAWHYATRGATQEQLEAMEAALVEPRRLPEPTGRGPDPGHVKGLAPRHIRPPSWWKGDDQAYRSMVEGARDLGEPVPSDALRRPALPGKRS